MAAKTIQKRDKRPIGRPLEYKTEYCDQARTYFNVEPTRTVMRKMKEGEREWEQEVEVPNYLPNIAGLARILGVSKPTIYEWMEKFPDFSSAVSRARVTTEDNLIQNGLTKMTDPKFSGLLLNALCKVVPTTHNDVAGLQINIQINNSPPANPVSGFEEA